MAELNLKLPASTAVNDDIVAVPVPEDRGTEELVIALVGPIGSGVSECAKIVETKLVDVYGYKSGGIKKLSDLIQRYAPKVEVAVDPSKPYEKTEGLQKAGTKLRQTFGSTAVIDLAIAEISQARPPRSTVVNGQTQAVPPTSRRLVTIIDAVKNPAEVRRLKAVYKSAFWLIGVFAPEDKRHKRLKDRFKKAEDRVKAMRVDEDEQNSSGQRVAKTMELADYFIRNNSDSIDDLSNSVDRFLKIIFNIGVNTPTLDESSMYAATAAASRSACLSRQVGVVIVNADGEIIGTGTNDVPKFGGGLYPTNPSAGEKVSDARCYNWQNGACHNDERKKKLSDNATEDLMKYLRVGTKEDAIKTVASSEVKSLIEFSRAVHAEMEAIVSVARTGGKGLVGSTLFSTTFPCHSCARHIVAAGIRRAIYIEPYAKSLAIELHDDTISTDEKDGGKKVVFLQYEGVAPNNYLDVFKNGIDRKRDGLRIIADPRSASPVIKEPLDDFTIREDIATGGLSRLFAAETPTQS